MLRKLFLFTITLLAASVAVFAQNEVSANVNKLGQAMYYINRFYLDTTNLGRLTDNALEAMMKQLDPHSTYTNEFADLAKTTFHSTSSAAACCAKEAGAGKLVLGHYSSRYKSLDTMLEEAQEIFPNSVLAKEGMKFDIPLEKYKE